MQRLDQDDEDFGEGFIAESHPLKPTHLSVPMGGRGDSRAPSISSSVSDLDVPIYTRETTVPMSSKQVSDRRKRMECSGAKWTLKKTITDASK